MKETKTVQCYPSDSAINRKCEEYGAFGWELISNNRYTDDEGTYGGYRHTSTYNKLTFTREKSSSWYNEITKLESEYNALMNKEPSPPIDNRFSGLGWYLGVITIPLFLIGVIVIIVGVTKKKKYKARYSEYSDRKRQWENTDKTDAQKILEKARAIVDAQ